jgi:hypothetical protein
MKKLITISAAILSLAACSTVRAQSAFTTIDSIDINHINAAVLVHGDMWWNPVAQEGHCYFPNGTKKSIAITGALWMSGYDAGNNLHISAQTYRQNGNDYWPGPINSSDTLPYATSQQWARIWKLKRTDIQAFQAMYAAGTATPANTAAAIWTWPAKGNTGATGNGGAALSITTDMAPFVDLNGNGIYEPQLGEYPDVMGDEALWWVFSDKGATHTETNGRSLGVEVHAMAYAYSRGAIIDNAIFYQYTIQNKSATSYQNFRFGQFADMDLGYYNDDYVGIDTTRSMGIIYNGDSVDALYGANMPMAGIIMRSDSGMGSFMSYANDNSVTGNPHSADQYNNYLRSTFTDGTHAIYDYTGYGHQSSAHGTTGTPVNYMFFGNPADHTQWSECSSGNFVGDRRFVLTGNSQAFSAGGSVTTTMILVTTDPGPINACGDSNVNFNNMNSVADAAIAVYDAHGLPPLPYLSTPTVLAGSSINIYPNPAHDQLYIESIAQITGMETITIYNTMGQVMNVPQSHNGQKTQLDINLLPPGLYNILYRSGDIQTTRKFIKE